jgi:hypothetical protein
MSWTFNGVRIFVTGYNEHVKQLLARLQPLGLESIYHYFGYQSPEYEITAYIVGDADKFSLRYITGIGGAYTLSGPEGELGIFDLADLKVTRNNEIWQSLRQDLDCEEPVYTVVMSLYQDY